MAGLGTKVFLFALILSFCVNLWAGTKVSGIGANSKTFEESQQKLDSLGFFVGSISDVIKSNMATSFVSAIGIVFGNPYLAFAGIALTLFNMIVMPNALINEMGSVGLLLSNMLNFLYAIAAISWFAGRGDW